MALPEGSRVHPVFHVSQLKQCLRPGQQVLSGIPSPVDLFQVPVRVLQRRVRQDGSQVLVQWSGAAEGDATWEDYEALNQQFPRAPACGQAGIQDQGIVSVPVTSVADQGGEKERDQELGLAPTRPRRKKKEPAWLADYLRPK